MVVNYVVFFCEVKIKLIEILLLVNCFGCFKNFLIVSDIFSLKGFFLFGWLVLFNDIFGNVFYFVNGEYEIIYGVYGMCNVIVFYGKNFFFRFLVFEVI